jgi:hypothetical protein
MPDNLFQDGTEGLLPTPLGVLSRHTVTIVYYQLLNYGKTRHKCRHKPSPTRHKPIVRCHGLGFDVAQGNSQSQVFQRSGGRRSLSLRRGAPPRAFGVRGRTGSGRPRGLVSHLPFCPSICRISIPPQTAGNLIRALSALGRRRARGLWFGVPPLGSLRLAPRGRVNARLQT